MPTIPRPGHTPRLPFLSLGSFLTLLSGLSLCPMQVTVADALTAASKLRISSLCARLTPPRLFPHHRMNNEGCYKAPLWKKHQLLNICKVLDNHFSVPWKPLVKSCYPHFRAEKIEKEPGDEAICPICLELGWERRPPCCLRSVVYPRSSAFTLESLPF